MKQEIRCCHLRLYNNLVKKIVASCAFFVGSFYLTTADYAQELSVLINGRDIGLPSKDYVHYLPHGMTELPAVALKGSSGIITLDKEKRVAIIKQGESQICRIVFETLPELDLYLCIGQSNMAGRGPIEATKGDLEPLTNVYLFTPSGNWEPAKNPLNRYSTVRKELSMQQISPAYAFAKTVVARNGNRPIGLVVNAKGGTAIESWLKGAEDGFYEAALKRASDAKPWGTYRAILWHQGEGNSGRVAAYPQQLQKMVNDLRTDLQAPNLFFVAGQLGQWRTGHLRFNEMIQTIGTFLPHSSWVSTEGLQPLRGDITDPHFDREGQLLLGERYANCILKNVYLTDVDKTTGKSEQR